jgi:ATP-dependent helicase HrpA
VRLYDELDFNARPPFTDPEILRSSLAGVILRMKSLRLTDVESFPFIEPPPAKAIADGYALLQELGAVDDDNALTRLASRWPACRSIRGSAGCWSRRVISAVCRR